MVASAAFFCWSRHVLPCLCGRACGVAFICRWPSAWTLPSAPSATRRSLPSARWRPRSSGWTKRRYVRTAHRALQRAACVCCARWARMLQRRTECWAGSPSLRAGVAPRPLLPPTKSGPMHCRTSFVRKRPTMTWWLSVWKGRGEARALCCEPTMLPCRFGCFCRSGRTGGGGGGGQGGAKGGGWGATACGGR